MPVPTTCLNCGKVTMRPPAFAGRKFCDQECFRQAVAEGYAKKGWTCAPDCSCRKHLAGHGRRKDMVPSSPCLYCGSVRRVSACHGPGQKAEKKFCDRACFTAHQQRRMATRRATGVTRKYDMPEQEFQNRLETQGHKCAICSCEIGPQTAHRDHCHSGGQWRGLLCGNCNKGLGLFRDDPSSLMRAAEYLVMGGVIHAEVAEV